MDFTKNYLPRININTFIFSSIFVHELAIAMIESDCYNVVQPVNKPSLYAMQL